MKYGLALTVAFLACVTSGQSVLFDFNGGPQYEGTPLDQIVGGVRAHFDSIGTGYSIQDIAQVIGVLPAGFSGLGLSPDSVYPSDMTISFWDASSGNPLYLNATSFMVAPQELACDTSSTMRISAYDGTTLVGTTTATATGDSFTWPTINLDFSSALPFDNLVIHFESGPPSGGDWGPIFVADNLVVTPAPEPACMAGLFVAVLSTIRRRRT